VTTAELKLRGTANREDGLLLGDDGRDGFSKCDGMGTGQKWDWPVWLIMMIMTHVEIPPKCNTGLAALNPTQNGPFYTSSRDSIRCWDRDSSLLFTFRRISNTATFLPLRMGVSIYVRKMGLGVIITSACSARNFTCKSL
jgi:hypothetical protein